MATVTKYLQIGKGSNGAGDSLGDAYNSLTNALSDIFTDHGGDTDDDVTLYVDGSVSTTETIATVITHNPIIIGSLLVVPASGYEPSGTGPQIEFAGTDANGVLDVDGGGAITWQGFKFSSNQTGSFAYLIRYTKDTWNDCRLEFGGRQPIFSDVVGATFSKCLMIKTSTGDTWHQFISFSNTAATLTINHCALISNSTNTGSEFLNGSGSSQKVDLNNTALFTSSSGVKLTDQTAAMNVGANNARSSGLDTNLASVDFASAVLTNADADDFVEPSTGDYRATDDGILFAAGAAGVESFDMFGSSYDASTPDIGFFQNSLTDLIAGSTTGTFTPTATTSATANFVGASSTAFTVTSVGHAISPLSGAATIDFTVNAAPEYTLLAGVLFSASARFGNDMFGESMLDWTVTGAVHGRVGLAGSARPSFAASSSFSLVQYMAGASSGTFSASGTLVSTIELAGPTTMTITASGALGGNDAISGTSSVGFSVGSRFPVQYQPGRGGMMWF